MFVWLQIISQKGAVQKVQPLRMRNFVFQSLMCLQRLILTHFQQTKKKNPHTSSMLIQGFMKNSSKIFRLVWLTQSFFDIFQFFSNSGINESLICFIVRTVKISIFQSFGNEKENILERGHFLNFLFQLFCLPF